MTVTQLSGRRLSALRDVKSEVSPEEWEARVELAALYQLVHHFRWTDTIYNHISLRTPGEHSYLINPFGYLYEEITASSLVKVDVEGGIVQDYTGLGINQAGFVIHGAIHAARPDLACVMHTHTRAGSGVSAQDHGLLPISQHAAFLYGRIGYHEFEGVAVDLEERKRLVADLGDHKMMILRNHGLLTCGRTAAEAIFWMINLERACEIQIAALSAGEANVRRVSDASLQATAKLTEDLDLSRDWAALLRIVERVAPHYCT